MKRTASVLLIILFTLASSTIAFGETFTIKLSHQSPATDDAAEHLASLAMINYIDKHSDGRIEVKYFPGAQPFADLL